MILLLGVGSGESAPPPQPDVITSFPVGHPSGQKPSVHVRDITNGYDLYTLNADSPSEYPASTVKLMTVLLAYEYHSADWTSGSVTVTADDLEQPIGGLTVDMVGFTEDDVVSWEGLAYGMMHPSGADACYAAARVIGTEIYVAAGSTGTTGVERFVERMNSRAAELGMADATFTDPFGGSKTLGPDVVRNVMSARDLSTLCEEALSHTAIRNICGAVSGEIEVTGVNARTIATTQYNRFVNGPTAVQAGISDAGIVGGKNGVWSISGVPINHNLTQIWVSPEGYEVVVTTIGSISLVSQMLDQRGLIYSLLRDFPYLYGSESVGTDASWSNVKLLVGSDGSIVDESSVGRALTITSVTVGDPVVEGSGGAVFNAVTDAVTAADAADITVGSGDLTAEVWYGGNGTTPASEYIFFGKYAVGQAEWLVNEFNGNLQIFASADGSGLSSTVGRLLSSDDRPVFHNGAPRHIAIVKSGSVWYLYLDGERMGNTLNVATAFNGTAPLSMGLGAISLSALGTLDEFRATFGTARYTAAMVTLSGRKFPRS
jgi:hypothetical protein